MACCDDETAWYQARIDATKALIIAYENALTALASGAQSYSLDTGQTRQTVTKANVTSLKMTLGALENRYETLKARMCGGGTHVTPNS
jgi:hypothetical protein